MQQPGSRRGRFEVLLEEIRDDVKILAEGHVMLDRKIEHVDTKLDRVVHELSRKMDLGFATLSTDIRQLAQRLDTHERFHASS